MMVSSTLHASISDSAAPNPRQILSAAELLELNQRSDLAGALAHTAIIGLRDHLRAKSRSKNTSALL